MPNNLIVVESPSKIRTIQKYLSKDYTILSSVGHIMDLPAKELGVDVDNKFEPNYVVMKGKEKVISDIQRAAKRSKTVYIATDPDREGEIIAWHIYDRIKDTDTKIYRVLFYEITKHGIEEGLKNTLSIDMDKVAAQQGRRILDRLVGYKISPLLWKPLKYGLSAGRVQSVALKIITQREEAIEAFKPKEYWSVIANCNILRNNKNVGSIEAKLDKFKSKKFEINSEKEVDKVIAEIQNNEHIISKIERKSLQQKSPKPFITSTMQQDASNKIGFSTRRTMSVAQKLYEGIEIAHGYTGLITYMRTDSTRVSKDAIASTQNYINDKYGKEYKGRYSQGTTKGKSQDAHEAIRPTDVNNTPASVKKYLSNDEFKLYNLIWCRFVASLMANAIFDNMAVTIGAGDYGLRSVFSILKFDGFKKVYDIKSANEDDQKQFPDITENDNVNITSQTKQQHFTQPPKNFTEASLVKELEANSIGRPSTYASIISTLVNREYVLYENKKFTPTELGRFVNELLTKNFHTLFEIDFTAKLEDQLDEIETGKVSRSTILEEFYKNLDRELQLAKQKFDVDLEIKKQKCPECTGKLHVKYGKNGIFAACSTYPTCSFTSDVERLEDGSIKLVERQNNTTHITCNKCNSPMVVKNSRNGEFLACSTYPTCKGTKSFIRNPEGEIIVLDTEKSMGVCPTDQGKLVLRFGQTPFIGCSNYPKCKYSTSATVDENGEVIFDLTEAQSYGECEKCGQPMVRKFYRGRSFLACSGYPDCKNTKSMAAAGASATAGGTAKKTATKKATTTAKKTATKKATTTAKKTATKKATTATAKKTATKKATTTAKKDK